MKLNHLWMIQPDMRETDTWGISMRQMGRKENTIRAHRNNVLQCLRYLEDAGRSTKVADLTTDDVLYLYNTMRLKETVKRSYLRSLSLLVIYFTGVDIVKKSNLLYNREQYDRVFISPAQFKEAYDVADPLQRIIMSLGAYMGLRRAEMASIRDSDIHGDMMTIHGKGHGKDGMVVAVRIPGPVREEIELYRASEEKKGVRKDDFLIQTRDHHGVLHRINVSQVSNAMTDLSKEMGFPLTTHSLRRFFATTLYYETDCDLQTVRSLMRHANVATTLKCYVDAFDERERVASEKLTDWIDKLVERSPEEGEVEDGQ